MPEHLEAPTNESAPTPPAPLDGHPPQPTTPPAGGFFASWCAEAAHGTHANVRLLTERHGARAGALPQICECVRDHFVGLEVLARMGFPRAAAMMAAKLPTRPNIRFGDLGEILATEYVVQCTEFYIPLKRLRHKDDREMAIRGDDLIGLHATGGQPPVLKGEVKSRANLSTGVVGKACASLEKHRGRPKPETLAFTAVELRHLNRDADAERIEDLLMTKRLGDRDIVHLVFTFSGNDPGDHLAAHADVPRLIPERRLVGLRVCDHQDFIERVFTEVTTSGTTPGGANGADE